MDRPLTLPDALAILRAHRAELEARGIRHAALFGSLARGEAGPSSDIDVLIDFEPGLKLGVFQYAGHKDFVSAFFPVPVDVVAKRFLRPEISPSVEKDAIYAF
jgi:uncharacterized protein